MKFSDKYAPTGIENILGKSQKNACRVMIKNEPQIVLLTGDSGVGKTTTAKIYASHLLDCSATDLKNEFGYRYINARTNSGVDFWKGIEAEFAYSQTGRSVFVVDEVDQLSTASQKNLNSLFESNSLPDSVFFIFCTLDPYASNFKHDFRDRLTPRFQLTSPTVKEQKHFMIDVFKQEGMVIGNEPTAIKNITPEQANDVFETSDGSIRVLLDNIQALLDGHFISGGGEEADNIVDLLLGGEQDLGRILKSIKHVSSFTSIPNAMCRSVINNLSYKGGRDSEQNRKVLTVFGKGLDPNVAPKVSFVRLVVEFLDLS